MSHLPALIADLALILICAGVMTLLFKKLKQPLVLGYVVAGFLASPHMPFTPSVMDTANIKIWADIGVIFLLFALGLEFSFKKIVKVGGSAIIAACTIIFCMIFLGIGVGMGFGWHRMDCLFLGGMIAMSSTTIIYKAFDDLGLRKKQFTGLVLGILILEDILAIVLMVMLSTMAASQHFEGTEMLESVAKLVFFLILWFVVGIYLIPLLLRRARKLMSEETLLITSLALCFGMVVLAAHTGFSAAFGAFIMGSILAETIEAESIERLVKPVKDLFGAIFFVSVGMMVDPEMIIKYALPIFVITVAVILGQAIFGTLGVILSGKPLKTAMQCGFSLTQIGEFAFIIASLGVSLQVTSDFLYPVVVAVSVITTFLTPYMIRIADPVSTFIDTHLPVSWQRMLKRYSPGAQTVLNHESLWKSLLLAMTRITVVYSIVSISIITLSFRFVIPLFKNSLPHFWASLLGAFFIILCISPFLRAIMVKKNRSVEFTTLWHDNRANRAPLIATIVIRVVIAALFVAFVIAGLFKASVGLMIGVTVLAVLLMIWSRQLKKQSILIERRFFQNLRSREIRAEYLGEKKPAYAGHLLSHDLHLADMEIPGESPWAGKMLTDLNLGKKYGIHIVSILRGKRRINIPGGSVRLFPFDKIQVIGTDELLNVFSEAMSRGAAIDTDVYEKSEMVLKQLLIDENSIFLGKTVRNSGIRDKFRCLVAGVESEDGVLMSPDVNAPFERGDVVWVVGEKEDIYRLFLHK
ncbi:TrkA protein [Bacteroides pyogenes F0041]|uniref:TrkA protein n=1 Tax=Bacteroides pyogenes F0041 TaxID=1321819 RepID=U2CP30_9BACE|nr:cation:proton antiporter [Bacteroides pyogenes]ERI86285.1 TrkA protein [Bacteroides pyogenes F0041]GAE22457.1 potassium/proton antiporter rosb [Bacteroides pyogenes JCM 10003]SUV35870.1 Na+/H+ antiporter [Bacteroides pyogenes]